MRRLAVAGIVMVANIAGPTFAADCSALGGARTSAQIQTLLAPGTGVYACYNNGSKRENNETLLAGTTTGTLQDVHTGGTTVENEGTLHNIGPEPGGHHVHVYVRGGSVFLQYLSVNPVSGSTYQFVNTATTAGYNIVISSSPGTC